MNANEYSASMLDELLSAFNRHDLDGVMQHFAENAIMVSPSGANGNGRVIEGAKAIRSFFAQRFESWPDMRWESVAEFACGDRAVTEWRVRSPSAGIDVLGCDLWTFRDGKVVVKDIYLKQAEA